MTTGVAPHPVIGIIGGMGPDATIDPMRRVLVLTPAQDDGDHIHMIADDNPKVPSRIARLIDGTGIDPAPELCRMARGPEAAGQPSGHSLQHRSCLFGRAFGQEEEPGAATSQHAQPRQPRAREDPSNKACPRMLASFLQHAG